MAPDELEEKLGECTTYFTLSHKMNVLLGPINF